jgi:hypothetical protein
MKRHQSSDEGHLLLRAGHLWGMEDMAPLARRKHSTAVAAVLL